MAVKQVFFGYRITDVWTEDIFRDSGMPHLTSIADAVDAARLIVKQVSPVPVTVVPFSDNGTRYIIDAGNHGRYDLTITQNEVPL